MRTRYYALTVPFTIHVDTSYNMQDGDRIEEVTCSRQANSYELLSWAERSAYDLYLGKEQHLKLFTTLEEAQEYAEESKLYQEEILPSGRSYYPHPWYQHGVVEIFLDSKKSKELKEDKMTAEKDLGRWQDASFNWHSGRYISKPNDKSKSYTYYQVDNQPQDYVMNRVWIKNLKPVELHNKGPKTYQKMFAKSDVLQSVRAIFNDYHSPTLFSCHWRHHKKLALAITAFLTTKNPSIKEAYDFLFNVRQNILVDKADLNKNGSFMRRLEFAMKQIRNAAVENFDETPTQTTKMELKA